MIKKGYTGAPFGLQSHRFDLSGVHPKLKMPGTFISTNSSDNGQKYVQNSLGPGYYSYEDRSSSFCQSKLAADTDKSDWKRKYLLEMFSQMPHILNKDLYLEKLEMKRSLGPGHYSIDTSSLNSNRSVRGLMSDRVPRFRDASKDNWPGPGNYGKDGIPHMLKDEGDSLRRSASNVGLLNNGGDGHRTLPIQGCDLSPNLYNIRSFTEEVIEHRAGNRGYYDIFSLDRTKPNRTGHLAIFPAHEMAPNHYKVRSNTIDLVDDPRNSTTGRFLRTKQYPYPPPPIFLEPDPKTEPYKTRTKRRPAVKENNQPFLSACERSDRRSNQIFTGNCNTVGPGRYDMQLHTELQHVNAHKSDFDSKKSIKILNLEKRLLKERLRSRNMPPESRSYVDHVSTEISPIVAPSSMASVHCKPLQIH